MTRLEDAAPPRLWTMQRRRYWLTLVSGTLECLCFAGVVFGFASLVFVLKEERYFSQLCSGVPGSNGSQGGTGEPRPRVAGGPLCWFPQG
uniref:Uncharacterized protein n=1 Tax=Takifugu rubripes TaxID=31033 RepID=H2UMF9_TAKRU